MSSLSPPGRRRRHSESGEHGSAERWLVSYADLITLLFAFFVVLFAISQADLKKFREMSEGMRRAFSGAEAGPVFPGSAFPAPAAGSPEAEVERTLAPDPSLALPGSRPRREAEVDDPELLEIRRLIEEAMEFEEAAARAVELETGGAGGSQSPRLRWVIQDSYPIRGIEIADDFRPLLARVARVLSKYPGRKVTLEGHADLQEQAESDPRSWRLAYGRAEGVARFLIEKGVTSERMTLSSRGDEAPLNRDATHWARARNRRVLLLVD
jgi:chemotaxis protein MotB